MSGSQRQRPGNKQPAEQREEREAGKKAERVGGAITRPGGMGLIPWVGHKEPPPGSGEQGLLQEPGCQGPALGMEDRQLDPLGQLLSSSERLQPSGQTPFGKGRAQGFPGGTCDGSGGSKRPLYLLLVSRTRPFEAEKGASTTLSHRPHHLLQ